MSNNNIGSVIYPLDYTGVLPSNLISNEAITLPVGNYRAFSPLYSPYFGKNIVITDLSNNHVLTGGQYQLYNLVAAPSAIAGAGNSLYSVVIILDSTVSSNLSVTYQTVGGAYSVGYDSLVTLINNLINNSRSVNWNNVTNLPTSFPENFHLHSLGSTVGWEYLVSELEQLRTVIQLGDQVKKDFVLTYIDTAINSLTVSNSTLTTSGTPFATHVSSTNNPHSVTAAQIGLGNVVNYATATNAQALAGSATNLYVTAAQVTSVVQNAINLGMDAHISNTANPHSVTATQVGLGNVANYGLAVLSDLQTPVPATPKYVINTVLGTYLTSYFTTQASSIASQLATLTTTVNTANTTANTALTTANAANATASTAAANIANAVTVSANALAAANANTTNAAGAVTAAQNLLNTYTASAVSAATSAGYSKGYADGHAAALAGN